MSERVALAIKTALFFAVAPGTVAGWVPAWIGEPVRARFPGAVATGWLLIACGIASLAWCGWHFVAMGRGTPAPIDAPRELVRTGLYRYTRNPMYVSVLLIVIGQALIRSSMVVLTYATLLWLGFHAFVRLYEEPTLRAQFGAAYAQYCDRVPRWLGRGGPTAR